MPQVTAQPHRASVNKTYKVWQITVTASPDCTATFFIMWNISAYLRNNWWRLGIYFHGRWDMVEFLAIGLLQMDPELGTDILRIGMNEWNNCQFPPNLLVSVYWKTATKTLLQFKPPRTVKVLDHRWTYPGFLFLMLQNRHVRLKVLQCLVYAIWNCARWLPEQIQINLGLVPLSKNDS
jgi:hypothetical protein